MEKGKSLTMQSLHGERSSIGWIETVFSSMGIQNAALLTPPSSWEYTMSVTPFLKVNNPIHDPNGPEKTTLHSVVPATFSAAMQALNTSCSNSIILRKGKVLNIDWERQQLL